MSKQSGTEWIDELRQLCAETSQGRVAKEMDYSPSVISQVLRGRYRGNIKEVEKAFYGAFKGRTVACPVLGEISTSRCRYWQRQGYSNANRMRVQLYKQCKVCEHNSNPPER
jgi:hypothetical protein